MCITVSGTNPWVLMTYPKQTKQNIIVHIFYRITVRLQTMNGEENRTKMKSYTIRFKMLSVSVWLGVYSWTQSEVFKRNCELLNLTALKISTLYKNRIFECISKTFCVEFQRGVSGLATDSPCGVWGSGWTTYLLHDSPLFGPHFKMRVGM